jgi:hypothetical protein
MMQWSILVVLAIASSAVAIVPESCQTQCQNITAQIDICDLQPLSVDFSLYPPILRNVSGLEDPDDAGPITQYVTDYEQAKCFCGPSIVFIDLCYLCMTDYADVSNSSNATLQVVRGYYSDCNNFGYFSNEFWEPTTTVTAPPYQTSDITATPGCPSCGIIDGQLNECHLVALNQSPEDDVTYEDEFALLHNRTAATCLCTDPVLSHATACRSCLKQTNNVNNNLNDYISDCHLLGYWAASSTAAVPTASGGASGNAGSVVKVDHFGLFVLVLLAISTIVV